MDPGKMFNVFGVAGSGMAAQRVRMELIAQNLAHAQNTDRGDGKPWIRREAVFQSVVDGPDAGQVRVADTVEDKRTPPVRLKMPGHPNADAQGYVSFPNVNPIFEMTDLLSASRAYEANLQASRVFRQMVEQALDQRR